MSSECVTVKTGRNKTSPAYQFATKDASETENIKDSTPDPDRARNKIRNKPIVMTQLINS